ncbi:MAG: acyl-CoA synthase, partial [Mycobacterium sp.]|nr:acyl-CoA synthase [Mycobacterium sp.]
MTWVEQLCATHEHSARQAVIDEAGSVTGRELIGKAVVAAELLESLNVPAGQPIPALLTTSADALATLLGGAATNRPLAPLGPRHTPAELADLVRRCDSTVLLAEPAFVETARQAADLVGATVVPVPDMAVSSGALPRQ